MNSGKDGTYDLVVVGGGPAGATLATFVAMQGHRVLIVDRDTFPRYQIGESLLPSTINGICVMLGVEEEIAKAGFTKKLGGSFRWGKKAEPWSFYFGVTQKNRKNPAFAYQVERMKFDWILLQNAIRKGVELRTGCNVTKPILEGDRFAGVEYVDENNQVRQVRARYVADASGNRGMFGAAIGERLYSKFFKNWALFGYYEGGKRFPPPYEGNILSAAFGEGWFWYIPVTPTLTSVGAVFSPPDDKKRPVDGELEAAMNGFIAKCPIIADMLSNARRVTEGIYGKLRMRQDWSYTQSRFWDRGLVLVGDAACFVDPLLSQGVHLATYSALLAARSINSCLAGSVDERRAFEEFELRYRREYGLFYDYLTSLYDMNSDQESFFWAARSTLKTEERGNEAFIRLLAGQASADPAINVAQDFFDSRQGSGAALEQVMNPTPGADTAMSTVGAKNITGLLPELDREAQGLQMLATFGGDRPAEKPFRPGGLITSQDGMYWQEPAA
ncbi:tryptophan 7-halogenase [Sorangium sp. So ce854]|uniref:tryptophan 7-halogenase n=1 Tax=Sorangium sp. So ce854 TaxID=3133322 RepID=UPI003F5EABBE